MNKIVLILLLLSMSLYAGNGMSNNNMGKTKTDRGTAVQPADSNKPGNVIVDGKDEHGNSVYERVVDIQTSGYKVDNFWKKFSWDGKGQDTTTIEKIATKGTVRVSIEATSLCTLYPELDQDGCSGQKPFLMNSVAVPAIDSDVSLIFKNTPSYADYNKSSDSEFFPLDIDRNEKFYKSQPDNKKSFFGLFSKLISIFFRKPADSVPEVVEDIRQRYMTNIVAGVDQDHLMKSGKTAINTTLNTPVSLIDYSETATTSGYCRLGFFRFPLSSHICNFPFFVKVNPPVTTQTDTIVSDTESSLVAFAGSFVGDDIEAYNNKSTRVEILEPVVSGFFGKLKCFFFGCPKTTITRILGNNYAFPNETGITMSLAVSNDGSTVDSFETFRLLGIRSVFAQSRACKIKKDSFLSDRVIYVKPNQTIKKCKESSWFGTSCEDEGSSYEGNSVTQWLTWCKNISENGNPGSQKPNKAAFSFFGGSSAYQFHMFGSKYSLKEYNDEDSNTSLVLDLKRIKLDLSSKDTIRRYQLVETK